MAGCRSSLIADWSTGAERARTALRGSDLARAFEERSREGPRGGHSHARATTPRTLTPSQVRATSRSMRLVIATRAMPSMGWIPDPPIPPPAALVYPISSKNQRSTQQHDGLRRPALPRLHDRRPAAPPRASIGVSQGQASRHRRPRQGGRVGEARGHARLETPGAWVDLEPSVSPDDARPISRPPTRPPRPPRRPLRIAPPRLHHDVERPTRDPDPSRPAPPHLLPALLLLRASLATTRSPARS